MKFHNISTSEFLHLWFDVWVPATALSVNFPGKSLFLNFPEMEKWCSLSKQNWFAAPAKFSLSTCFL